MTRSGPVLLIGGTGFVGSAVARRLAAEGIPIRCLVRPRSDRSRLAGLEVDFRPGDLTEPESVAAALEGCGGVVHLASPSAWSEIDSPRLPSVVVEGTRSLLALLTRTGSPAMVFVSTMAAVNGSDEPRVFDEESAFTLDGCGLAYAEAKREAEALCRAAAAGGKRVVIVNPAEVYGPGDVAGITSGNLVDVARSWPVVLACRGGTSVVHVDDVAQGIAAALRSGRSGERYILGGDNLSVVELARLVLDHLALATPVLVLPRSLVRGLGRMALACGLPLPLEPRMLPYATRYWFADSGKARRELGFTARPAREVLGATVDWLVESGRLPRG